MQICDRIIVEIRGLKKASVKHTYWEGEVEEICFLIHKKEFSSQFSQKENILNSKLRLLNIKLHEFLVTFDAESCYALSMNTFVYPFTSGTITEVDFLKSFG